MGVYNTYGDEICMQMKVAPVRRLTLEHFSVGDKVHIPDGAYLGYEGVIIVREGILVAESSTIFDKWGGFLSTKEILDPHNPVSQVIKEIEQSSEVTP